MEEHSVVKQNHCFGCLCEIDTITFNIYSFKLNVLIEMLQIKQLPLCNKCTKQAEETENFIQNIQDNQRLLQDFLKNLDSNSRETKPPINRLLKLNSKDLKDIIKTEIYDDCETEQTEIKTEEVPIEEGTFDEDNVEHEFKTNIKEEPQDVNGSSSSSSQMKSVKKKEDRKVKVKKSSVENGQIELMNITIEQCMKEREEAAKEKNFMISQWKCTDCVKAFAYKTSFEQHMELHDETKGDHECSICKLRYTTLKKKIEHENQSHLTRYKCKKCNLVRILRSTIRDHYTTHHSKHEDKFKCLICAKVFPCHLYLKRHAKRSHSGKVNKCPYCIKILACETGLKTHIQRLHTKDKTKVKKPRPYSCAECGATFSAQSQLKKHSYKHSTAKPFYCVECDKSFKSETGLYLHLKSVEPHVKYTDLPFQCGECDKRFSNKGYLVKHIKSTHLNLKPFKCNKCDKSYISNHSLNKHQKLIHEGYEMPRIYACSMCDKKFQTNAVMKNHLRTHTGERPFVCTKCSATFTYSSALHNHKKLVHLKLKRNRKSKTSSKA